VAHPGSVSESSLILHRTECGSFNLQVPDRDRVTAEVAVCINLKVRSLNFEELGAYNSWVDPSDFRRTYVPSLPPVPDTSNASMPTVAEWKMEP
jgi:hypothetical protein